MLEKKTEPGKTQNHLRGFSVHLWPTKQETERSERRFSDHIRPDSIFLAPIGTMWQPGAWQKVVDVFEYMNDNGYACWMDEMMDTLGSLPHAAVPFMMNRAVVQARNFGMEYVCLVNNDCLPEPDILVKLLRLGTPITIPYMHDYDNGYPLMGPVYKQDSGAHWLQWCVYSFMLFRVNSLACLGAAPFTNCINEGDFWDQLWMYGHRAVVDTNTELKLASYPTRPGSLNWDDRLALWGRLDEQRRSAPDRRPIDLDDPRAAHGVYVPWLFHGNGAEPDGN